jgi:rhamnogalacturonan endolyase
MSSWNPGTYTVGSSSVSSFPMALFKSVNSPLTIKFTATSSQTGAATLRIGTTLSFAGGRPQAVVCWPTFTGTSNMILTIPKINSYTGSVPTAPTNLNSRGVTRGAYRGFGEVYDVSIPAGTIVAGTNTVRAYKLRSCDDQMLTWLRSLLVLSLVAREKPTSAPIL